MRDAYPVFIKQDGKDYLAYVPDLGIYTEGTSLPDAIEMGRDAIGLKVISMQDDKIEVPAPSNYSAALKLAKEDADEDFDFSDGTLTLVDVDFDAYRRKMNNRSVKKNCTIPYWLSIAADKANVNYSRVLQDALVKILGVDYN